MSFVRSKGAILASLIMPLTAGCTATEEPKNPAPVIETAEAQIPLPSLEEIANQEGALAGIKRAIEDKQPDRAQELLESMNSMQKRTFDYHILRAKTYCLMADLAKVPLVFDSEMPKADIISAIKTASKSKFDLYETALAEYRLAKAVKDDVGIDKLIAVTYWQRHLSLFRPEDAKAAEQGFIDIIKKSPEQSDAYVLLGGIYVWYSKTTTSKPDKERYLTRAYMNFIEAETRHKKRPLDEKMLQYVRESIKALKDKLPKEGVYH
jgi:tetratricopeptide (TPR) repeat protein